MRKIIKIGNYMRHCKGYVLFIVLVFAQLFALISLFEMRNARWFLQLQILLEKQQIWSSQVDQINETFNAYDWANASCLMTINNQVSIRSRPLSWWQQNACAFNSNTYFYIEKLISSPCAIDIKHSINQPFTVQYYRVTLAFFQHQSLAFLSQATYAEQATTISQCQNEAPQVVELGRQMVQAI